MATCPLKMNGHHSRQELARSDRDDSSITDLLTVNEKISAIIRRHSGGVVQA